MTRRLTYLALGAIAGYAITRAAILEQVRNGNLAAELTRRANEQAARLAATADAED